MGRSQCVLNCINSQKALGTFVENRIKEIKEDRNINFHYISTSENPTDTASRGTAILDLEDNDVWWHGPEWLKNPKHRWPKWRRISTCRQNNTTQAQTESELQKTMSCTKLKSWLGRVS